MLPELAKIKELKHLKIILMNAQIRENRRKLSPSNIGL